MSWTHWRTLVVAGVVAWSVGTVAVAAPTTKDDKDKSGLVGVEKVRKGLDEVLSLDLAEQPLALALNQIREQTKLNIVIDRVALANLGYDAENLQVSVQLKDVKVKSALRALLNPYNLNYVILGDTLLVSSDDVALHRQLRQRITLDVQKKSLNEALKQLAKDTACNILIDTRMSKEAVKEVTLEAEDIPLETAVRLMCEMAGLKPVRVGNVLFVTSKEIANEMRNDPELVANNPQPPPPPGVVFPPGGGLVPIPGGGFVPVGPGAGVPMPVPPPLPPEKPVDPEKPITDKSGEGKEPAIDSVPGKDKPPVDQPPQKEESKPRNR